MLTHEDVQQLTAYFQPNEHEFLKGMTYLTEGAITRRIEAIDPAWSLKIYDIRQRDKTVTAIVQLTIKGVSRDGVGMSVIQYDKDTKSIEVNEAEKSAVTDALKRAARLFGIGRYLLDLPDNVKDMRSLADYLKSRANAPTRPANQHHDRQSHDAPQNAPSGQNGANSGKFNWKAAQWWKAAVDMLFNEFEIEREHGANLLNKWAKAGHLTQDMPESVAIDKAHDIARSTLQF